MNELAQDCEKWSSTVAVDAMLVRRLETLGIRDVWGVAIGAPSPGIQSGGIRTA